MRDPKRIKPLLDKIEALWYLYPDLRFGQLVTLIYNDNQFYCEDDSLDYMLDDMINPTK